MLCFALTISTCPRYDVNISKNIINRQYGLYEDKQCVTNWNGLTSRLRSSLYTIDRLFRFGHLRGHEGCVNCLSFNKTGSLLVTGSDDLRLIVWDWMRKRMVKSIPSGHQSNVFQSKFFDVGDNKSDIRLISSARDGRVHHTHIQPSGHVTTTLLYRHADAVHKVAVFDAEPHEVWSAGEDGRVVRMDVRDEQRANTILRVHSTNSQRIPLFSIAAHPTEPHFCLAGRDKFVRVYDKRQTKKCMRLLCPLKANKDSPRVRLFNCIQMTITITITSIFSLIISATVSIGRERNMCRLQ